jgi:hypothetical protein
VYDTETESEDEVIDLNEEIDDDIVITREVTRKQARDEPDIKPEAPVSAPLERSTERSTVERSTERSTEQAGSTQGIPVGSATDVQVTDAGTLPSQGIPVCTIHTTAPELRFGKGQTMEMPQSMPLPQQSPPSTVAVPTTQGAAVEPPATQGTSIPTSQALTTEPTVEFPIMATGGIILLPYIPVTAVPPVSEAPLVPPASTPSVSGAPLVPPVSTPSVSEPKATQGGAGPVAGPSGLKKRKRKPTEPTVSPPDVKGKGKGKSHVWKLSYVSRRQSRCSKTANGNVDR